MAKKKRERTQECQNCGYFRALKKTHSSEQTGSATCLSIIPACTSKPYLLPLSHAAHNNHTSHTRTTEGHSWTTDLYCCFTLKLTSKTSLTSGLEQLCVGDPHRATTLSFSNLVFSSSKHSKTIHCLFLLRIVDIIIASYCMNYTKLKLKQTKIHENSNKSGKMFFPLSQDGSIKN